MPLFDHPHNIALTPQDPDSTIMRAVGGRDVLVLLRLISLQNVWAHNTLEIVVRRQWDDDQAGPREVAPDATYKDTVRSVSRAGVVWSLPVAHGEQVELAGPEIKVAAHTIEVDYVLEVVT